MYYVHMPTNVIEVEMSRLYYLCFTDFAIFLQYNFVYKSRYF